MPLSVETLAFPQLTERRHSLLRAVTALAGDEAATVRALKLGRTQLGEVARNAAVASSPTTPVIDRYTGVLYDALDAASLDASARRWLGSNVLIHTAPLGPVGALDRIPAYRLGAGVSLPGSPSLRRVWADAVTEALAALPSRFVLDMRSEAYVALGPVPASSPSVYVRVVSAGPEGTVRSLNHFNKHAKGVLVRALAQSRPRIGSVRAFARWADSVGVTVRNGSSGELELFA